MHVLSRVPERRTLGTGGQPLRSSGTSTTGRVGQRGPGVERGRRSDRHSHRLVKKRRSTGVPVLRRKRRDHRATCPPALSVLARDLSTLPVVRRWRPHRAPDARHRLNCNGPRRREHYYRTSTKGGEMSSRETSKRVASKAGKVLSDPAATASEKSAAASALTQYKSATETSGKAAASKA